MKKFLAVLLSVALLLGCMNAALANPSISDLSTSVVSIEPLTELPEGVTIVVREAQPDSYADAGVAKIVNDMADENTVVTPADVSEELADYDFITNFSDVVAVKDGVASFELDGAPVSAKITFDVDALKGVAADDLGSYSFLLINPATGEFQLLSADAESFDSDKGEVTVEFPFLGTFALVQKVA